MLVVSRDAVWLESLKAIAGLGGWPFEARAALPAGGRVPSERALVVLDRALAGAAANKAVESLRATHPGAAIVLAFDAAEMDHDAVTAAVSCGADEVIGKSWSAEKVSAKLAFLRDRALAAQERLSSDGSLKAEKRAHRALIKSRGRWKEVVLDAGGFALLWRLLAREGELVSREDLGAALAAATGREREAGTVTRRLSALKKALSPWSGGIESSRGGFYRLAPVSRGADRG